MTKSTVHGKLNVSFISYFAPTVLFAATMEITIHEEKNEP